MTDAVASALQAPIDRLTSRSQFLRVAATGRRWVTPNFIVQANPSHSEQGRVAVGFTASRKVGGAVVRNRAKRRLREVARHALPHHARLGWSYVFVARHQAREADYATLMADARWALGKLASGADLGPKKTKRETLKPEGKS